jgi:hypothetical protein
LKQSNSRTGRHGNGIRPIIEKFEHLVGKSTLVEIEGYLGSADQDVTRLFLDRTLGKYVDIPKRSVIHCSEPSEHSEGAVRVTLDGSTTIKSVSINIESQRADQFQQKKPGDGGPPIGKIDPKCVTSAVQKYLRCVNLAIASPDLSTGALNGLIKRCQGDLVRSGLDKMWCNYSRSSSLTVR